MMFGSRLGTVAVRIRSGQDKYPLGCEAFIFEEGGGGSFFLLLFFSFLIGGNYTV